VLAGGARGGAPERCGGWPEPDLEERRGERELEEAGKVGD
jgi:hypothetical protein